MVLFGLIVTTLIITWSIRKMNQHVKPDVLRVAFPASTDLNRFDPARVQWANQYLMLENLYSPLLSNDLNGDTHAGLSSKFYWRTNEIHFEIRNDLKASDGLPLTAADALASLQRLVSLGTSTHGDLRKLLCEDGETDHCSRMRVEGNSLILTPKTKNFAIFKSFGTIDFAVIPKRALDPISHEIKDFSITSGPYYIENQLADGTIILKANKFNFEYSTEMAQEVHVIPVPVGTGVSLLKQNKIDFLTSLDTSDLDERIMLKESDDFSVHGTMATNVDLIHFTSKGLKELSAERRWAIAKRIKDAYNTTKANSPSVHLANQFFPPSGKGSLPQAELAVVENHLLKANPNELGQGIVFSIQEKHLAMIGDIVKIALPLARVEALPKLPEFDQARRNSPAYPHVYFITMDAGFLESLPNISNAVICGLLGNGKEKRDAWLKDYLTEEDETIRIQSLRRIHFESLSSPVIVPLAHKPYVTVVRKPWTTHFSTFYPNCPFNQILWKK